MDTDIIIPWGITITITIATLIFFIDGYKRREKKILLKLENFASENQCIITYKDHWDKSLIGLDIRDNGKLLFIRKTPERKIKMIINLQDIKNCNLVKTTRNEIIGRSHIIVTDRIELILNPGKLNSEKVTLEFYNTDYNPLTLSGELQLAKKWKKLINNFLENQGEKDESSNIVETKTITT